MSHFRLALLLALVISMSPLAMDAYLPAFPEMARALGVSHHQVGLSVSVYLAGLAVGHLVGGPLSDRYGRRRILDAGIAMFVAGSLGIAFSSTLAGLLGWRLLEALGAGFCVVSVPAIARDRTSGVEAARLFSLIALVTFIAPASAPTLGTGILLVTDWSGIFLFLAVYALGAWVLLRLLLFRGTPVRRGEVQPLHTLVTNYGQVLRNGAAMRLLAIQSMVFAIMMLLITHGSFIFQGWFAVSKGAFSAIMAGNIGAMALFNLTNRWLLRHWEPVAILRAAVAVQGAALAYLLAVTLAGSSLGWFLPGLVLGIGTFGAVLPNTFSTYLDLFPRISATAAAMMGALRFTIAGLISGLSSLIVSEGIGVVVGMMAGCSLVALILARGAPAALAGRLQDAGEA